MTALTETMMRPILSRPLATLLFGLAALLAAGPALASGMMVVEAFARASATPSATSGAAYVSVMNHGEDDRLVGVMSAVAKTAEIHKTELVDGVMKMAPAGPIALPAHGTLQMKPGGYHIMLMGLARPLVEGEKIEVTLSFEKAGSMTVTVPVGAVAAGSHDHSSGGDSGG
jgi:copper(I)-binding protein